jgi:large subunit ribosomal protein L28
MGSVCELCGKHPSFGRSYSRLGKGAMRRRIKGKTSRRFNPNIQQVRAVVNGTVRRIDVCTGCIRAGKVQKPPMR